MAKLVLILGLSLIYFIIASVNGATFENVNGVLTENVQYSILAEPNNPAIPKPREKQFTVTSDDSITPYVKDEDTLTIIVIKDQKVPKLSKDSIKDLDKITGLKVVSSGLKDIEPGALNNVPKLLEVDLSDNELEEIKNMVFCHLGSIQSLTLENNKIRTIGDHAFVHMSNLKTIRLQNNKISTWNGAWFAGSPVSVIFMGKNELKELPTNSLNFIQNTGPENHRILEIADAPSNRTIVILYFQDNKIKTIQPGAFNDVGKVETLNLENNQIEELIAGALDGITSLSSLRLNHNQISTVDGNAWRNTKIGSIDLQDNKVTEFPLNCLKSKQVFYTYLKNNPLKCSFIQEVEDWVSNKDGKYDRTEFEYPLGTHLKELKKDCK